MHATELGLLLGAELGLFAAQLSLGAGRGHAFLGPGPQEVDFEFGEDRQDGEGRFARGIGGVVDLPTERERDAAIDEVVTMVRASGTERASRSSLGTTTVSPVRTAASAWSRPGACSGGPVSTWS